MCLLNGSKKTLRDKAFTFKAGVINKGKVESNSNKT